MAATKLGFLDQPNSTMQGYTLTGQSTDAVNLAPNHGIRVAVQDATGATVITDNSTVTIAFGTNPTSGSVLQGSLSRQAVNGVAVFNDLAVSLGGSGYTLTASDGALTTATSNAFTITNVSRINPSPVTGTITTGGGIGVGTTIGPYRLRPGTTTKDMYIYGTSTNVGDTVDVYYTLPGTTLAAGTAIFIGLNTTPFNLSLLAGAIEPFPCDIYVIGHTVAGTVTVTIDSVKTPARV